VKFKFKQFEINDKNCAMKVGTDAVLIGSWVETDHAQSILDVGTGCGIIALMLAQRSDAAITGIDVHVPSISDAGENFRNTPWTARLRAINISLQAFANSSPDKYDLIVSNPPFFSNSLVSPLRDRAIAKHNTSLSHSDLIKSIRRLLNQDGRFCVILPDSEISEFKIQAANFGFYTAKQLQIIPKKGKPANRVIAAFSMLSVGGPAIDELTIRDENNAFTQAYINLTKEFYLKF
jgi:tRNA1Val (adenine37-N6)-methyltransferase